MLDRYQCDFDHKLLPLKLESNCILVKNIFSVQAIGEKKTNYFVYQLEASHGRSLKPCEFRKTMAYKEGERSLNVELSQRTGPELITKNASTPLSTIRCV